MKYLLNTVNRRKGSNKFCERNDLKQYLTSVSEIVAKWVSSSKTLTPHMYTIRGDVCISAARYLEATTVTCVSLLHFWTINLQLSHFVVFEWGMFILICTFYLCFWHGKYNVVTCPLLRNVTLWMHIHTIKCNTIPPRTPRWIVASRWLRTQVIRDNAISVRGERGVWRSEVMF